MLELLPLFMFVALFVLLFLGVPIAFALFFTAISFALYGWGAGGLSLSSSAVWGVMNNFTLVAIPLFILMSVLLERANIVADLYDSIYKWSGGLRGGLAIATIVVGAVIGAISGVVAAGVIGLALIAYPHMRRYKYDENLGLGTVMAGGTLGQLIPPSLNMIVYGAITGVSVSSMFAGGFSAGLVLIGVYIVYILIRAYMKKDYAPALERANRASFREKVTSLKSVILPLVLIVVVLGSILTGIATPTEAAGVGVLGTVAIGVISRKLSWPGFKESIKDATRMTGMVGWILAGAAVFSAVFSGVGGNRVVSELANSAPGGKWGVLVAAVLFIFVLGMFLETMALIMLAAPIITPIVVAQGFDPLWWGILFMVVLQMAFVTPPFGFAIFYLKSALRGTVSVGKIYTATYPVIGLQAVAIVLVIAFPAIVMWLPALL